MLRQAARLLRAGGERAERGAKALAFAEQHRGAAQRTMNLLRPYLEKNP
jgi:3-deoxy-D-manno-octulosonic-acid transferase